MHNALIVKKREHFEQKKIVKEKFLKSYSKVLTELINNILQILNEDRALTYKFLEISQIQELLKQCKDRIVQFSQKQSKKIIKIQRIHQDLHMEQVLYNKIKKEKRNKENGIYEYYFLDFEGDPQFSLEQKQEKYPVERDMATFIRSLSYIKYNTLKDRINQIFNRSQLKNKGNTLLGQIIFTRENVKEKEKIEIMKSALNTWERELRELIVKNYEMDQDLLRFFLIERMLREINYECKYRPENILIPMIGLKEIIN